MAMTSDLETAQASVGQGKAACSGVLVAYEPSVCGRAALVHAAELIRRAVALLDDPPPPDRHELRASLRSFSWFLDRAGDGGIPLTAAGCLKPADMRAAAQVLPTMGDWIGEANRETHATPVLHFRKLLQSLGLLRKHKGALQQTRAGSGAFQAPRGAVESACRQARPRSRRL